MNSKMLLALALILYTAACCSGCSTKMSDESSLKADAGAYATEENDRAATRPKTDEIQKDAKSDPRSSADTSTDSSNDTDDSADYGPCPTDYCAALRMRARDALQGKYLSTGRDIEIMVDTLPLEKKRLSEDVFGWKGNLVAATGITS